jgi:hypothetical protein
MGDLEALVANDMTLNGYDPSSIIDVYMYWSDRL